MRHSQVIEEMRRLFPQYLGERYLEGDDASVVLNEYLTTLRNLTEQLEELFLSSAGNRESEMENYLKLLHEIRKKTSGALASLQRDGTPEDANIDL